MNNDEIKELQVGVDMSSSTGRRFKKEPAVNVISKEDFEMLEEEFYGRL